MDTLQPLKPATLFIRCGSARKLPPLPLARKLAGLIGLANWRGWFEPFPGLAPGKRKGRAQGFDPWTDQWPDPAHTPELAEIRVGGYLSDGRMGGFHIVQDDDGAARWFAYAEACFEDAMPVSVGCIEYSVLPRKDGAKRFFAEIPGWLQEHAQLELVEYWQSQRLLAWLVVDKKRGGL